MSHSTRILFLTFLLSFGFGLPPNALSINYPNPWICEDCNEPEITFYVPLEETFKLRYTGNSVEAFAPVSTHDGITGGIFGKNFFEMYKVVFFWNTDYLTYVFTLQVHLIYFNRKYKSYENSLKYDDGIAQITIPIFANGLVDNPLYKEFDEAFDQVKNNPGKITNILNKNLVIWFKNTSPGLTYAYYKSLYINEDNGKSNPCATTVNLPLLPLQNYISYRQYLSTFGSLVDASRKHLNNPPPLTIPRSLVGLGWDVKILDVNG